MIRLKKIIPTKAPTIGLRQAKVLTNLPWEKHVALLAEGLPLLLASATELEKAARTLTSHPRSAAILHGHAREECAKILILMDLVRCPRSLRAQKIGQMIKWFYDHLARAIFVEAQFWKPTTVAMLQDYVDDRRKSHFVDGDFGQYIFPNWSNYERESTLYVDIALAEDGEPYWSTPNVPTHPWDNGAKHALQLCQSFEAVGLFSRKGLEVASDVWGKVNFENECSAYLGHDLTRKAISSLDQEGLIRALPLEETLRSMYNNWQIPMYNINFSRIDVPLSELEKERDAHFWSEVGDYG